VSQNPCRVFSTVRQGTFYTASLQLTSWCEVHQFELPVGMDMCPMGRIEKAVEDGIERIRAATAQAD
jgi:hypothetical protein